MTKAYRLPVLLIEFDRDRAFALQVLVVLTSDVANFQHCVKSHTAFGENRACPPMAYPVLQSPSELADDISGNSLGARLALLALHFPRLRMIWSRSLHATVDIFRALKAHQDEPDPVAAAAVGASTLLTTG
jgi:ERCC4-type nuclease